MADDWILGKTGVFDLVDNIARLEQGVILKTQGLLELYVDAINGSDSNPGTQSSPLKTYAEFERRIPRVVDHTVKGYFAAGTYIHTDISPRLGTGRIRHIGTPRLVVKSGTLLSGSGIITVVTDGGLGVDTHVGKTIEITSGPAAGCRRTIESHTDTTVTVAHDFVPTPNVGDSYVLYEPTVVFQGTPTIGPVGIQPIRVLIDGFGAERLPSVYYENIKTEGNFQINASDVSVVLLGVYQTDGLLVLITQGGSIYAGLDSARITARPTVEGPVLDGDVANNTLWAGWGIGGDVTMFPSGSGMFMGIVGFNSNLSISSGDVVLWGGRVNNITLSGLNRSSYLLLDRRASNGTMNINGNVTVRGAGALLNLNHCRFNNPTGTAILVERNGNLVSTTTTTGIEASTTALKVQSGGQANISGNWTGLNATGNVFEVGPTPVVGSLVDLPTVGSFIDGTDGSFIRRIS